MILLRKKRITFIVFSVFLSILVFTLIKDKKEIVPTVSLPVSGKTIVIDAGHGKPDEGDCLLTLIDNN